MLLQPECQWFNFNHKWHYGTWALSHSGIYVKVPQINIQNVLEAHTRDRHPLSSGILKWHLYNSGARDAGSPWIKRHGKMISKPSPVLARHSLVSHQMFFTSFVVISAFVAECTHTHTHTRPHAGTHSHRWESCQLRALNQTVILSCKAYVCSF